MQTLKSMAKYGDESKVSALAQKWEASFADFAAAFGKPGTVRASRATVARARAQARPV